MRQPKRQKHPGFVIIDFITAMTIVTALSLALTVALSAQSRSAQRFGDERTALRAVERVLIELQTGQPVPTDLGAVVIHIDPPTTAKGIAGKQWIRVRGQLRNHEIGLFGMVPADAPVKEKR